MTISKKTIDGLELSPEVKAELQKVLIEVDHDSYLLTPAAMDILNSLNAQAIDDVRSGVITLNFGKLGELNHNDRTYMNGEHITASKTTDQIISEVSHPPLDKLTMKSEYKFESWEKAMKENPDQVLEIDSLGGVTGEIKGVQLTNKQSPVKVLVVGPSSLVGGTDWAKILGEGKEISTDGIFANGVRVGTMYSPSSPRKTMMCVSTGMALCTDMEGWGRQFRENEKEVVPTVRTNGRQKLVDNGKRQWPEAKRRKGHRKG